MRFLCLIVAGLLVLGQAEGATTSDSNIQSYDLRKGEQALPADPACGLAGSSADRCNQLSAKGREPTDPKKYWEKIGHQIVRVLNFLFLNITTF